MAAGDSGAMATQMLSSSKQLGIRLRRSPPATTAERNDHCVDTEPVHGVDASSWILASRILHQPYPCPCSGAAADVGSRRATCVLPVASEPCWVSLRSVSASFLVGGAIERLAALVGPALEIIASSDDYDATTAELYGWVNRAVADNQLDEYVDRFARRQVSFDARSLGATKRLVNRRARTRRTIETPSRPCGESSRRPRRIIDSRSWPAAPKQQGQISSRDWVRTLVRNPKSRPSGRLDGQRSEPLLLWRTYPNDPAGCEPNRILASLCLVHSSSFCSILRGCTLREKSKPLRCPATQYRTGQRRLSRMETARQVDASLQMHLSNRRP